MRVITRLDETCREVRDAARVIGDAELFKKMEEAQIKIKRDSTSLCCIVVVGRYLPVLSSCVRCQLVFLDTTAHAVTIRFIHHTTSSLCKFRTGPSSARISHKQVSSQAQYIKRCIAFPNSMLLCSKRRNKATSGWGISYPFYFRFLTVVSCFSPPAGATGAVSVFLSSAVGASVFLVDLGDCKGNQ